MSVISVDDETNAVIAELARRLHTTKQAVLDMLIDGEIKVGGNKMDMDTEEKIRQMLGKKENGSMIDKMMEMKMLEKLDNPGDKQGGGMGDLMEILKVKMMMEAMQDKKNESIDPNMILMLYLMKSDSGKTDMTKIVEAITNSTKVKDTSMTDVLKQLLEEKKETEKEKELMEVIDRQNEAIERLKEELTEMRRYVQRPEPRDSHRIDPVKEIESMKDNLERLGLTKPLSSEDREMSIKEDVVKEKARLERETLDKTHQVVDKVLDGIDRKADKLLAIVQMMMRQPPQQREQTLEEFEARGQITPEEKRQIYQKMQEETMKEMAQPPQQQRALTDDEKADMARQMWENGYKAADIARQLHMSVTETYKYKPKV